MSIETNEIEISVELQQMINAEMAYHYQIIPYKRDNNTLTFFISESKENTVEIQNELEVYLGKEVSFEKKDNDSLKKALFKYYRKNKSTSTPQLGTHKKNFLESVLFEAKSIGSSDIHFEVYEEEARVRFRIDGVLIEKYKIEIENYLELINKIKIESNLDITEKRLPQDGRINYANFDIRVSILPTLYGEKIVMRILGKDADHLLIEDLGFDVFQQNTYLESIRKTNGIVLISGPTGSGKTTTLYASLKYLNNIKRNILTVEDPIEYTLNGINQVQLKESIGLTFATALKSFLRQDPDIIMLGEIRDSETANMAIRASLTGHLVLSTIHTNSAIGTISRLIDMGVPPFYIAETLNASVAQRLIRKLCPKCKKREEFDLNLLPSNFIMPKEMKYCYVPTGCPDCHYTGYVGRKAIYEIVPINEEIIDIIKTDYQKLKNNSKISKIEKLSDKAFDLFYEGVTSLDEVYSLFIN